jgi:L-iditol 2-dehydrogenase
MATSVACHQCSYCKMGYYNLCDDLRPMGFSYAGGMAEYVTIPQRALDNGHVIKVPDTISAEHAALAEPLSCAVNACENADVKPGDSVVISGAGPLGIMNLCVVRSLGASQIILAEISAARLAQAGQFDCDILVNPAEEDLAARVKQATDGLGADVAIVAAPAAAPQEAALDLVRKRGRVCLFASLPAEKSVLNLDSRKIHYGEIRVVGTSDSTPAHVKKAVELLGGDDFPAAKIASHVLALDDIFKAFELMKSGAALRVILKP